MIVALIGPLKESLLQEALTLKPKTRIDPFNGPFKDSYKPLRHPKP